MARNKSLFKYTIIQLDTGASKTRRKKHAELSVQDTDWATMNQELKTIRHKHECLIHIQFRESLSGPSLHVIIYCEIHATEDSEICKLQSESFP